MQPKINLQSFKSTPDSLKQRFKAFGRKPSLGAPEESDESRILKIKIKSWSPLEVQILWFDNPFRVFGLKNTDLDFPKRIHGPRRGLHVRVYSFVICGFIRCGKNRNSGRYAAISVMVSTVFIYDRPFAFADGARGKPSV